MLDVLEDIPMHNRSPRRTLLWVLLALAAVPLLWLGWAAQVETGARGR